MSTTQATVQDRSDIGTLTRVTDKYLTFRLDDQDFGINILDIREIISMITVTPLPQAPDFVKGIINLRGMIIPVIDLRKKLGMESISCNERSCIVVVDLSTSKGIKPMSILVDAVSEVIAIEDRQISPPPVLSHQYNINCIDGVARLEDSVKLLLNIKQVILDETLLDVVNQLNKKKEE